MKVLGLWKIQQLKKICRLIRWPRGSGHFGKRWEKDGTPYVKHYSPYCLWATLFFGTNPVYSCVFWVQFFRRRSTHPFFLGRLRVAHAATPRSTRHPATRQFHSRPNSQALTKKGFADQVKIYGSPRKLMVHRSSWFIIMFPIVNHGIPCTSM